MKDIPMDDFGNNQDMEMHSGESGAPINSNDTQAGVQNIETLLMTWMK
jgi:hypothetical protein